MIECLRSFLVNIARMFLPKAGADAEVSDEDKGSEHSSDCNNVVTSESQKQYFTNFTSEWMHRQFSLASEFDTNTGEDMHKTYVKYFTPEPMHLDCVGIPAEILGYE